MYHLNFVKAEYMTTHKKEPYIQNRRDVIDLCHLYRSGFDTEYMVNNDEETGLISYTGWWKFMKSYIGCK